VNSPIYTVEPWCVREPSLHLDRLAQSESVFALANGHIGLRGNLDEGEPFGLPGTYLNSVYELRPLPHGEAGYGYPESGQSVINVTNGKLLRLLVADEPFDVRYGELLHHERVLDLRAGTLSRDVEWQSPAGCPVRVRSTRVVSLSQRSVAAIHYEVTAPGEPLRVVVQSELVANESLPDLGKDPRVAAALESPLQIEEHAPLDDGAVMVHRTRQSGLLVAAAMTHLIEGGAADGELTVSTSPDASRVTVVRRLGPGETLSIVKFLAYGWSSQRSRPAVHDQVVGALAAARHTGWAGLLDEQKTFLDEYWDGADVELDGDPEVQQAVRFSLFHVLQAGARAERRPIPAKGLTGPGYDGHTFWDTESFVLPVLIHTQPQAAADALHWRYSTLEQARTRAALLGLAGAAFPWRTITGDECSSYWPAGTAAFHINADIAGAVIRYVDVTGDERFEERPGLDILVETARLWRALGHHDTAGRFRIDGVTGPDEYSAIADNNVYTNLMAEQNLRRAADAVSRYPDRARELGVSTEEAASWRDAAADVFIPYDDALKVHPQSEGFTEHAVWDFAATGPDQYPLLLHFPYFDLYRKQVVKQADLVLAMHLRGDAFSADDKARNFAYYEALTVRDSSLSASTQAVLAAEVGHLDLAHDYIGEAALMDLHNLEHNTGDGLHMGSLAGAWIAVVAGLGGMRTDLHGLHFAPRLPDRIGRLSFRLCYRGRRLNVAVSSGMATYQLVSGEEMPITHHRRELYLGATPVEAPIPPIVAGPTPTQPPGRRPTPRGER
jgi:alpha,alpha-trehalose phosphorylase